MDILLTGATGFIGLHLIEYFISNKMRVYCIVRNLNNMPKSLEHSDLVKCIEGDLLDNHTYSKLPKTLDGIIHLAGLLGEWNVDERKITQANLETTVSLLDWFCASESKHFILVSTPGVQGFGHRLAKESDPYNPRGIYEKTKVLAEETVKNGNFGYDQKWTIMRPDFVYGPGDIRRIKLYKWIKKGRWLRIGNGKSIIRPTHVYDVCEAICVCLQNPKAYFQIFNVGGPELVTWEEYVNIIAEILDAKILSFGVPRLFAIVMASIFEWFSTIMNTRPIFTKSQVEFLTQHHGTDISKIQDTLGFSPIIDLRAGIDETIDWAEKHYLI